MKATTLDKRVTKFCKKFGVNKAFASKEFCYYSGAEIISYTFLITHTDKIFIDLVNEKYGVDIRPWYFIFCLLHEIGHHLTLDTMSQEELFNDYLTRTLVIPLMNDERESGKAYIDLTAEHLATSWAIDYIDSHLEECREIQNRFMKIIAHYNKKQCLKQYWS